MQKVQQRERALERANEVRTARKAIKGRIKAGELHVADLILEPSEAIATAKIGDLLQWAPGIGPWRAKQILAGLASPSKQLRALGETTRGRIAERLSSEGSQTCRGAVA